LRVKIDGTRVATCNGNFARPHFTADGKLHPTRREAHFASPLATFGAANPYAPRSPHSRQNL
jgi:hypothetical protein